MTEPTQGVQEAVAEPQASVEPQVQQPVSDAETNLRALRDKLEATERQYQFVQQQNELYKQQMQNQQFQQNQKQEPQFDLESTRDDDIPSYGDIKKTNRQLKAELGRLNAKLDNIEMRSRANDYDSVIKEYLPDVLKDDPDLAEDIQRSPRLGKLAYRLAQASPRYHEARLSKQRAPDTQTMSDNANRPQPAQSRKTMAVMSEDAQMANMSDEQIMSIFNMAKARS